MNCGSGKLFKPECLNIDINPMWRPDIVADLTKPFPDTPQRAYETARFGPVRLAPGTVTRIIAHDLLEHLPELTTFYTSCLQLLEDGGVLDVVVPYDLSHGAWQDPTHVRAFNENSWLYVTDWHWYLGWEEARFELVSLQFRYSTVGQGLLDAGEDDALVQRTPRAVDAMAVLLRKRACSPKEQEKVRERMQRYGHRPDGFYSAGI